MKLRMSLPLPVSINQLYINEFKWSAKDKKMMPTGRRILSKEGERVKNQIIKQARKQMEGQDWDYEYTKSGFCYLDTIIYFNKRGRDDNNTYKLLCDSLEKIAYDNDSRILVRTQKILYDSKHPRVEVLIRPVKYIGIFDNQEHLDLFESKCESCSRYSNNCSILRKAKEGFIQDEIEEFVCSSYSKRKIIQKANKKS